MKKIIVYISLHENNINSIIDECTIRGADEIMLVEDVHQFPGHIACDSASNSEIVLPIHANGEIIGVLDIDSPSLARFDEEDKEGLADHRSPVFHL